MGIAAVTAWGVTDGEGSEEQPVKRLKATDIERRPAVSARTGSSLTGGVAVAQPELNNLRGKSRQE